MHDNSHEHGEIVSFTRDSLPPSNHSTRQFCGKTLRNHPSQPSLGRSKPMIWKTSIYKSLHGLKHDQIHHFQKNHIQKKKTSGNDFPKCHLPWVFPKKPSILPWVFPIKSLPNAIPTPSSSPSLGAPDVFEDPRLAGVELHQGGRVSDGLVHVLQGLGLLPWGV